MSDLSEVIDEQRRRSRRTPPVTRKTRRAARRGLSRPGGVTAGCGCRYVRSGGEWLHVWPCRGHELKHFPLSDESMKKEIS